MTIWTQSLHLIDRAAAGLGLLDKPINPADLMATARRRTGLSDFGDDGFVDPMRRLLASINSESALGIVGRSATTWDTIRFLSNLLQIQDAFSRDARIAQEPIRQPIFITGLPRSGTTFLHRLMMADRDNRAPLVWETIYPSPAAGPAEQRIKRVNKQLKAFEWLAPEFRGCIRWRRRRRRNAARSPRMSSAACASIRPITFPLTALAGCRRHAPPAGLSFPPPLPAIPAVQDRVVHRWVLKCPEHLFALEAIRSVYPDARLIFVHRDPLKVLLSQSRLTQVLREPFTRTMDNASLGRPRAGAGSTARAAWSRPRKPTTSPRRSITSTTWT